MSANAGASDSTPSGEQPRPPRRIRYSGTHPRRFSEKYKERGPQASSDEHRKRIEQGKTPAGTHRPIMVAEILDVLAPKAGDIAVDCTLGYGGHAAELLARVQPRGRLIAIDVDPVESVKTEARLRGLGYPDASLSVHRRNYAGVAGLLAHEAPEGADVLLADLGLSSMQIDDPGRGFSWKIDGPLDMRMNPARGPSAALLLSRLDERSLVRLLTENADEPHAGILAKEILKAHRQTPLTTTTTLAKVIREVRRAHRLEDADESLMQRRVFQALRIAVNDELSALDTFLKRLPACLKPGGRAAILTFHSGEDRRVKHAFRNGREQGFYEPSANDFLRPSPREQHGNSRSSPAKLRWVTRTAKCHTDA